MQDIRIGGMANFIFTTTENYEPDLFLLVDITKLISVVCCAWNDCMNV